MSIISGSVSGILRRCMPQPARLLREPFREVAGQGSINEKLQNLSWITVMGPEVMSYVLQQNRHTYINYDVNRLVNVWVFNSAGLRLCFARLTVSFVSVAVDMPWKSRSRAPVGFHC